MEIRAATQAELSALDQLELSAFSGDRISHRQMKRFIQSTHARLFVAMDNGLLAGYALLLFHRGTNLARLYSLAIDAKWRGQGLAQQLMHECEQEAIHKGYITLRLEVRNDNIGARRLYEKLGYKVLKALVHYYDDLADGVRMHKRLDPPGPSTVLKMPLYAQTTAFSCGPASLLMAFAALKADAVPSRMEELRLWREATTIFMTSGHGGCSAHGLALSALRRGFGVKLFSRSESVPFIDGVRDRNKKAVIQLVHEDFCQQLQARGISAQTRAPSPEELRKFLARGAAVLLMVSSYRFSGEKGPHWIVLSGCNSQFFFFHDPNVEKARDAIGSTYVPISDGELLQVMRYGRQKQLACVVVFPQQPDTPGVAALTSSK